MRGRKKPKPTRCEHCNKVGSKTNIVPANQRQTGAIQQALPSRESAAYMQRSRPLSLMICPRQLPKFFRDVSLQRLLFFWQEALNEFPSIRMSRQVRE